MTRWQPTNFQMDFWALAFYFQRVDWNWIWYRFHKVGWVVQNIILLDYCWADCGYCNQNNSFTSIPPKRTVLLSWHCGPCPALIDIIPRRFQKFYWAGKWTHMITSTKRYGHCQWVEIQMGSWLDWRCLNFGMSLCVRKWEKVWLFEEVCPPPSTCLPLLWKFDVLAKAELLGKHVLHTRGKYLYYNLLM